MKFLENEVLNNLKYKKVLIGDICLYLCKMNFSVINEYSETPSVSGGVCVTNNAVKSAKITLDAKIIIDDNFEDVILSLENLVRDKTRYDISIGNLIFSDSLIVFLKFSDSIENGFASVTLSFVTDKKLKKAGEIS